MAEKVTVVGETLSVCTAPSRDSKLVQRSKLEIFSDTTAQEFAENIETVAHLMQMALNTSIVLEAPDVSIAVQNIGFNLTMLTERSQRAMHQFSISADGAVNDLESIYQELFSPAGLDAVALSMLEGVERVAGNMREQAESMGNEFEKMAEATKDVLELTQQKCAERREVMQAHINEEKLAQELVSHASQSHKTLTRSVVEADAILREAQSRERWAHSRQYWVSFVDDVTRLLQPLFGAEHQMRDSVAKARRDASKAKKVLDRATQDRLVQLQRKSEAMKEIVHLVQKIRNARSHADMAAVLVEALHTSAGALRKLSASMLKTATLWSQLERQASRLANPEEVSRLVRMACDQFPTDDPRRIAFWHSTAFKKRAVIYLSRWVATAAVCADYAGQMQLTRKAMFAFLESNPEYKEVAETEHWD